VVLDYVNLSHPDALVVLTLIPPEQSGGSCEFREIHGQNLGEAAGQLKERPRGGQAIMMIPWVEIPFLDRATRELAMEAGNASVRLGRGSVAVAGRHQAAARMTTH
jgi:hypothetical protein